MKSLKDYISESEQWLETPAAGDDFAIELDDGTLVETYIMAAEGDAILLDATDEIYSVLGQWATLCEDTDSVVEQDQGTIQVLDQVDEAKYQGREVPLGKPMAGDVKKSKVYVRDPATGNIKKVNFGDPKMKIKKYNPARRKSFRARHNCDNPGPRTKARYWSCRAW
jgi:hypothetical protein